MNAVTIILSPKATENMVRAFELSVEKNAFWIDKTNPLDFRFMSTAPEVIIVHDLTEGNLTRFNNIISNAVLTYKKIHKTEDTEIERPEVIVTSSTLSVADFPEAEYITIIELES